MLPGPSYYVDAWDASTLKVALNAVVGTSHEAVVVLDGLVSEGMRRELLLHLRGSNPPKATPPRDRWDLAQHPL